jgi:hypothetical protein
LDYTISRFFYRYDECGKRCGRIGLLASEIFKKYTDLELLELERFAAHLEFLNPAKGDLKDGQGSQRHNAAAKRVSDKRVEVDKSRSKFQIECADETNSYSKTMSICHDSTRNETSAVPIQEAEFPIFSVDDYKALHKSKPWEARVILDEHAKEVEKNAKGARDKMQERLRELQEKADEQQRKQEIEREQREKIEQEEKVNQAKAAAHATVVEQIAKQAEDVKNDLKSSNTEEYLNSKLGVYRYVPFFNSMLKAKEERLLLEKIRITRSIRKRQKAALGVSGMSIWSQSHTCSCCIASHVLFIFLRRNRQD